MMVDPYRPINFVCRRRSYDRFVLETIGRVSPFFQFGGVELIAEFLVLISVVLTCTYLRALCVCPCGLVNIQGLL